MLGIAMDEDVTDKGNEQISNDLQSPQRSILDFFKSPDKIKPAKKPTSLLSFFGTAQQKDTEKQQLKCLNGVEKQNGDLADKKVEKGPGKKRKQKDRETEKNDADDFEEEQIGKGKKRKKFDDKFSEKKEEGKNKDEKEKSAIRNSSLVNGSIDKVTINELGSKLESKNKMKERKSKDKGKTAKSVCEDNEAGDQHDKPNSGKQKVKSTHKSDETKKKLSEQKDRNIDIADTKTSKESKKKEEDEMNESEVKLESKETVSEMCYEDFIKSLGNSVSKTDNHEDGEPDVTEKMANGKTEEEITENTESKEDLYIKSYPTISSFFNKVDKAHAPVVPTDPKVLGQVTVKVDIHSEPSPNNGLSNHVQIKASPLYLKKDEEEIEIISSEIVTIDCTPSSKKSLFGVKKYPSDVECEIFKNRNESLAETLSSCEDSCMSEDSSVCVVEEVEDVSILEKKKCFLQSATVPEVPAKTTQRTLSFSKAGLQVQKPVKPTHSTRVRKKDCPTLDCAPVFESTPEKKCKPGRKPKKTFDLDDDKENKRGKETPNKARTPSKKSTKDRVTKTSATEKGKEDVCDRRTSLRSRYRVAIIGADEGKKTPIRMKFNRYSKSSSSGVEEGDNFTPRSSKQTKKNTKLSKAKELLQKAKQKNTKSTKVQKSIKRTKKGAKNDEESSDDSKPVGRRRSSRLSDKDSLVILDSEGSGDEVDGCNVKTPKAKSKTKTKGTKATPAKATPSKKSGKLASIFMSGKEVKERKPAVVLDPEAEKLKRAFLMSGVPEELRRQTVTTNDVMIVEDYPPLPTINHTQQREPQATNRHGVKLWDLENVTLSKLGADIRGLPDGPVEWRLGLISTDSNISDSSRIREFQKHSRIEDEDVEKILAEVSSFCPTYPVRKVFSVLKMKKDDFEQEAKEAEQLEKKMENLTAEEKSHEKEAPRRSLRKRVSLELPQVVELGGSPPLQTTGDGPSAEDIVNKQETVPTVSWTDKYLPLHSAEVVGNTAKVRKLQSWLVEWKQRLDKEARKAKKLQIKQNKGKPSKESGSRDDWWGDDSDFALDSDDSDDDEEDRLCNTAMLCGPSGIGKTASVYGLAHELGFKVFEVNASSTRNGKRILAQLQEATQSHQVSRGTDTPTKCPPSKSASASQANAKIPSAFSGFFKQTTSNSSNKTASTSTGKEGKGKGKDDKDPGKLKKRKRNLEVAENLDEKTPKKKSRKKEKPDISVPIDPKADGSLNLSSTSLILFEEVDVVFPSDHGFWSAVQQFMATTKIPIILTTSDAGLVNKFEGRFDHYRFKTPPYRNLAVYLQLMCLAENVRTDFWDMYNVVSLCCGDIRRCILSLQYWVISGGGVQGIRRSIHRTLKVQPQLQTDKLPEYSVVKPTDTKNDHRASPQKQLSSIIDDDDDDFVCLKPVCQKRSNRFVTDDEESNSMPLVPLRFNQDLVNSGNKDTDIEKERLPLVHLGHTTSLQGLVLQGHNSVISLLKQMLEIGDDSLVPLVSRVCRQYRSLKCDLLYRHHLSLLPLTTVESLPLKPTLSTVDDVQKKSRRRIKTFDLYDSETSNDGHEEQPMECDEPQNETLTKTLDPTESALVGKSLNSFYSFYDNLSLVDSMEVLENRLALQDTSGSKVESDFHSDIQLYSCRRLYRTHLAMKNDILSSEHICVPITQDTPRIEELQGKDPLSTSLDTPTCRASSNVRTSLPLGLPVNGLHQEYLPTLRAICKSEQLREQAKIKRRFQHYLDGIGLTLKDNTLSVLCTTFR
ncbi:ATPase family AAA domain-containing protein 5-like isoform X2 [Mizuhopecten yessoensis]|uniref:ATPase family AAA domain-containing protein 5-like isoform X2 n=1 Tax=Mizuhopecten yessoensis TaxID=6573 RepID=UPI000B45BED0|nr:ATPase family AAA domain-containing protein 5-like isoform X2 [Mizuhopecten yessoensis]